MSLIRAAEDSEPVSMTPLIDVVFNLLIFFLLGSTYLNEEKELSLELPTVTAAAPATDAPEEITVNVLEDGSIKVGGKTFEPASLEQMLRQARGNFPDQAVAIRGDGKARYESVAEVLAACRRAGIPRVDCLVHED